MSLLFTIARATIAACNFINFIDEAVNSDYKKDISGVLSRGSTVALDVIAEIAQSQNASLATLQNIKGVQGVNTVVSAAQVIIKESNNPNDFSWSRFIANGVLTPLSNLAFYGTEIKMYQEQEYLEMHKKDPNAQRPVYIEVDDKWGDGTHYEVDHYRPIDPLECQRQIESAKETVVDIAKARIALEAIKIGAACLNDKSENNPDTGESTEEESGYNSAAGLW